MRIRQLAWAHETRTRRRQPCPETARSRCHSALQDECAHEYDGIILFPFTHLHELMHVTTAGGDSQQYRRFNSQSLQQKSLSGWRLWWYVRPHAVCADEILKERIGEGALVALRGSPLGLATDMGKQISPRYVKLPLLTASSRINPHSRCILWTLRNETLGRKTSYRWYRECSACIKFWGLNRRTLKREQLPGLPVNAGCIGLISKDPQSIQDVLKLLLDGAPWIGSLDALEMPWRQSMFDSIQKRANPPNGRLAIAIMRDDGHSTPDPETKQALAFAEQSLRLSGHEVSQHVDLVTRSMQTHRLDYGTDN